MSFHKEAIRSKGLKVTPARLAILKIIEDFKMPVDVNTISRELIRNQIVVDQATIYRILEHFTNSSLVRKIQLNENKFFYETQRYDHHHAVCEKCGHITEIRSCTIDKVENEIQKDTGFIVKSHSLEFYGICFNCQRIHSIA